MAGGWGGWTAGGWGSADRFKSSCSGTEGPDCIEVATPPPADTTVHVRDSKDKDKDRARLAFADAPWADFVAFARR
ncbi:DUF397 domain-containing protein [Streptomyces sp. NPDC086777]|uniref:DUF397 domain-containing protein n=1 Tax=Streptomyces sp. NPDC086777 TaxID=3154866 RepID=UPI00344F703F